MHTWVARATLENGSPKQCACSLKGTWYLSAVGCLPVEPRASPLIPVCCSIGKTQGLWRLSHFLNNKRGSRRQHSWEKQSTLKCLQLENKACKLCTKKYVYLTISVTIPARSKRWFILVDTCRQVTFITSTTAYIAHRPSVVIFFG